MVNDHYAEQIREGTVQSVLSMQFTYVAEDGHTHFCPYTGDWKLK